MAIVRRPARRIQTVRCGQRGKLVGRDIKNTDRRSWIVRLAREDDLAAIGRPVGIKLLAGIIGQEKAGTSAIGRNLVDPCRLVRSLSELEEEDGLSVRRPARKNGRNGRECKLQAFGAINPT